MARMKCFCLIVIAALLAGCGRPPAVAEGAEKAGALPGINKPEASATGDAPAEGTTLATSLPSPAAAIPAGLHGHWALSPTDCTSASSSTNGLLVIGPGELRFPESRAVPAAGVQTSPKSISGDFAFTGKGKAWTSYQLLQLEKAKLLRTESNPSATFTYARC
ncbi:MAG TPA: hypothetical protein VMK31_01325 [Sphingomicrobium sp.]|nr:hypothetical protein [Sphingomicrobium sp.]